MPQVRRGQRCTRVTCCPASRPGACRLLPAPAASSPAATVWLSFFPLQPRVMGDSVITCDGKILFVNGAGEGIAVRAAAGRLLLACPAVPLPA